MVKTSSNYSTVSRCFLLGLLVTISSVAGAEGSITHMDFKDLTYPFVDNELLSVPSQPRWMPLPSASSVSLHDGRFRFPCDDAPCPLLSLDQVTFDKISGLPTSSALVVMTFHPGGSATWRYLYVVALQHGAPQVVAWLEAGSRADMGLLHAEADHGDLLLTVEDPTKRVGDCCSTGTITYRYTWDGYSFKQTGKPVLRDTSR